MSKDDAGFDHDKFAEALATANLKTVEKATAIGMFGGGGVTVNVLGTHIIRFLNDGLEHAIAWGMKNKIDLSPAGLSQCRFFISHIDPEAVYRLQTSDIRDVMSMIPNPEHCGMGVGYAGYAALRGHPPSLPTAY
jgi:hypothetical protein